MTATTPAPAPAAPTPELPELRGPGTWSLTWSGVRTVAVLELRQRIRSARWILVLSIWALLIGGLSGLIRYATFTVNENDDAAGATMFGVIVFMVLSLGALVAPALSATSINGDRVAGVLATMQSTLLTPIEIAIGKLLAAWTAALGLLVTALPFVGWAYLEGGTTGARLVTTLLLTALTLLVVCSIGLGYSALTARTSSSAVLTYLTVAFLGLGLPLLFALSIPFVQRSESVTVRMPVDTGDGGYRCATQRQVESRAHTENSWWLLAPSPYVIVSDAAPTQNRLDDPLSVIRESVREARLGPPAEENFCDETVADARARDAARDRLAPAWPLGLACDTAIAAGFGVLTVRRLRTPSRKLPRGTRVA
jgi:ABC-type transport system involved in multi-copper enzyme maturation permease subunit